MKKIRNFALVSLVMAGMAVCSAPVYGAGFLDVPSGKSYAAPVAWAVREGITSGTSDTTFSPNQACTRGQIVTFLYKEYGNDESAPETSFSDVKPNDYYAKAVNWAVEKDITRGKTNTMFAPSDYCTRAQAVTFLWKLADKPSASFSAGFTDVKADAYYAEAVDWAAEKGITSGVSKTSFAPNKTCKRSEIVTFMYRYAGSPDVEVPNVQADAAAIAQYRKVLEQAPSMGAFEAYSKPTGKYEYALVTFQKGEGPSLLLSQMTDMGSYIRVYYYDQQNEKMYITDPILWGARTSLSLAGDGNGFYYGGWTMADPTAAFDRVTREGNSLVYTGIKAGGNVPEGRAIQWYDLTNSGALDNWN